jgi:perosamine synthetase
LIVPSRPMTDFRTVLATSSQILPDAKNLYFYPFGRDALLVALRAFKIVPGDAIIIPAYICESTVEPLKRAGYRVVFVDVESDFQLDPDKVLETAEICDAKAVLAVHYFGIPLDFGRLVALLHSSGVRVIEDCCHSFLTRFDGRRIGSFGDAAIFSMRKSLPIPDGGAIRMNAQDFDRTVFSCLANTAPYVGLYLASRVLEAFINSVGWPNIYSPASDVLKKRLRGRMRTQELKLGADFLPPRQLPSRLLERYLSNEKYLKRVRDRTVENYVLLVKGTLALGFQPFIPQLPLGCVPQWMPLLDLSGQIVPWLRKHGVGACRWPWHELPADVISLPERYPISNDFNNSLALIPVHQSIGSREVSQMLHLLEKLMVRTATISIEKNFL